VADGPHHPPVQPSGLAGAAPAYRDAVLRPLFAAQKHHNDLYRRIDRAHAVMLAEQAILPRAEAIALLAGLDTIEATLDLAARDDAGGFEDLFFLREDALRRVVGGDLAGRLHTGRSRNDMEATIFRLQLKARMTRLMDLLSSLVGTVLRLARQHATTPILAYTHGQPAQPTTYGHYLAAFAEALLRDLARLGHAQRDLDACPMGAAAITTTGFPISRERVAELLGFASVQVNSYGCIAAADQLAAAYSALRILFLNIGRLTQDLAFWTSFEVGQARAPDGFVQISSIMPQKRNPLAIEHLRSMASLGFGHCGTVLGALHNTPFADMVDAEGPTQSAGLAGFDMADRVLPLLDALLDGLTIDADRVCANTDASCATMTELSDSLVRLEGIPFREAHDIGTALARRLVGTGRGMAALEGATVAEVFTAVVGRAPRLDLSALAELATPRHSIAVRDRTGGPGPQAMAQALATLEAMLAQGFAAQAAAAAREQEATLLVEAAVLAVTGR
jgi:argininosuccinate lyase